jgi:hypothetical protein
LGLASKTARGTRAPPSAGPFMERQVSAHTAPPRKATARSASASVEYAAAAHEPRRRVVQQLLGGDVGELLDHRGGQPAVEVVGEFGRRLEAGPPSVGCGAHRDVVGGDGPRRSEPGPEVAREPCHPGSRRLGDGVPRHGRREHLGGNGPGRCDRARDDGREVGNGGGHG